MFTNIRTVYFEINLIDWYSSKFKRKMSSKLECFSMRLKRQKEIENGSDKTVRGSFGTNRRIERIKQRQKQGCRGTETERQIQGQRERDRDRDRKRERERETVRERKSVCSSSFRSSS